MRTILRFVHIEYSDECVSISRDAMLQHTLCIGRGTIIGPSAVVRDSIIGKNCRIGANAVIIGSSIGDNVRIETGSIISESVICDDVLIKENSEVQRNCVLSYGVVIDRNTIVCTDTRISLVKPRAGDDIIGSDDEESAFGTSPGYESTSGFSECDEGSHSVDRIAGAAARAIASGGVPEGPTDFDVKVVGTMGAGYVWSKRLDRDPISVSRKSLAYDIEALALQENDIESHKFLAEENSLAAHAEEEPDQSDLEVCRSIIYVHALQKCPF
jgi:acetyltransferase-like isoleucine patch superfamily enzyme